MFRVSLMGVAERQVQQSVPIQEAKSIFYILNTTFEIGSWFISEVLVQ